MFFSCYSRRYAEVVRFGLFILKILPQSFADPFLRLSILNPEICVTKLVHGSIDISQYSSLLENTKPEGIVKSIFVRFLIDQDNNT